MLMRAFETIEQQGKTIEQQGKTIERLSQAHIEATAKAHSEFATAVSKQAELHAQLLAEGQARERGREPQGR